MNEPKCKCPICGNTMRADVQPALMAGRAATTLYTCPTCYLTQDARDLATVDVTRYAQAVAR